MSTALHADFGEEFISNPQHVDGDELCSEKVSHSRSRCLVPSRAEPFESSRRARGASARSFRDGTELLPPSRRSLQKRDARSTSPAPSLFSNRRWCWLCLRWWQR